MLKEREAETLQFIQSFVSSYGYAPTIREIGAGIHSCESNTHRIIMKLEIEGYIKRPIKQRIARGIVLI